MATLGIVGGIGPASTIEYDRTIIGAYQERHGASSAPLIVINSIDAHRMLGLFGAGRLPEATAYLVAELRVRVTRALLDTTTIHARAAVERLWP